MKNFLLSLLLVLSFSKVNAQWVQQTSGTTQTLYSVSGSIGGAVWVCGAAGTVLRTTNWGMNWSNVSSNIPSTLPLYNIFSKSNNIALVTGSDGTGAYVYKTTNGGQNWNQVFFQAGGFINVIEIDEFSNTGFMQGDPIGGRWSLWRTTDAGSTWDSSGIYLPQAGGEAGWNNSLFWASPNEYYFGTNNSRIYRTTNGGSTWSFTTTPDVNSYTVWFNIGTPYGLSGGTQLMRTTNDGGTWSIQSAPGTGNVTGAAGVKNLFWFVRQGTGIYFSDDDGAGWSTDTTITGAQFLDIGIIIVAPFEASGAYKIFAVGNGGRIYSKDFAVGINNITSHTPERYSLSQNYPNPFNPTTKIKFDIVKSDFVSLKVYNSAGQVVSSLAEQNLQPGTYEVSFDGGNLSSGIYYYTFQSGDFRETKKMVLIK